MSLGPVDVSVIVFEGNQFDGQILPAMREAVENGVVRIIDLVFVKKDAQGEVLVLELDGVEGEFGDMLDVLADEITGLVSEQDLLELVADLPNSCSVLVIVFENTWARRIQEAVVAANGRLVTQLRVPREVVEQALLAQQDSA